ncbi:MAG: transcription elongation factor GreA [Frankiaceae bacterium]|jgi:transcription elongation factor GreA
MKSADVANVTWLTQEAFDRLQREHDALVEGRKDISAKIEAAREEGDLKENGGYHAAKEEQGKQEARIRQLEQLLRTAKVGEAPTEAGVAGPGTVVTVAFGDGDRETFLIGSREDSAARDDIEVYSAQSPLGQALTGLRPGQSASYTLPNGKQMTVELFEVKSYTA